MTAVRRVAKNTGVLFIAQVITSLLGFFIVIYTARYLGAEGFGILSTALALTGIFSIFTDLGLSTLSVREVARDKSLTSKYVGNFAVMKLILGALTFLLIVLTVNLIGYSEQVSLVIYLITVSVLLSAFSGLFTSIFQAHERMEYQAILTILNSVILLAGVLIAIYYHLNIFVFAVLYIVSSVITLIYILILYLIQFSLPKFEIDPDFWKITLIAALPLSISALFSIIAFRIDSVLLSIIKGNIAVGFYNAPYRLMEALIFIPAVFTSAIYPLLAKFHISSKESLKNSTKKSFKYLIILSLPIAVGTTLLSDKIILIIYGSGFTPSITALQILIWTIPLIFLTYVSGTIFASINKQILLFKITAIAMVANITLNLIFIPKFSYVAASIITVITEFMILVICLQYLSQLMYKINIQKMIIKPAIASTIMGLIILMLSNLNIFLIIIISIIIYLTILTLLKTFTEEDIILFKQIIGKE
jgi:O-antigen/teichoic acid export membrane protein